MASRLTRPTLARRDAPFPKQGRNSAADPLVSRLTFHCSWQRCENAAGGLFQLPARLGRGLSFLPYLPYHTE